MIALLGAFLGGVILGALGTMAAAAWVLRDFDESVR